MNSNMFNDLDELPEFDETLDKPKRAKRVTLHLTQVVKGEYHPTTPDDMLLLRHLQNYDDIVSECGLNNVKTLVFAHGWNLEITL